MQPTSHFDTYAAGQVRTSPMIRNSPSSVGSSAITPTISSLSARTFPPSITPARSFSRTFTPSPLAPNIIQTFATQQNISVREAANILESRRVAILIPPPLQERLEEGDNPFFDDEPENLEDKKYNKKVYASASVPAPYYNEVREADYTPSTTNNYDSLIPWISDDRNQNYSPIGGIRNRYSNPSIGTYHEKVWSTIGLISGATFLTSAIVISVAIAAFYVISIPVAFFAIVCSVAAIVLIASTVFLGYSVYQVLNIEGFYSHMRSRNI